MLILVAYTEREEHFETAQHLWCIGVTYWLSFCMEEIRNVLPLDDLKTIALESENKSDHMISIYSTCLTFYNFVKCFLSNVMSFFFRLSRLRLACPTR